MLLIHNVLEDNGLLPKLIDLMHFNLIFDDSALNFFNHFFYGLSEIEALFVKESLHL